MIKKAAVLSTLQDPQIKVVLVKQGDRAFLEIIDEHGNVRYSEVLETIHAIASRLLAEEASKESMS